MGADFRDFDAAVYWTEYEAVPDGDWTRHGEGDLARQTGAVTPPIRGPDTVEVD